MSESNQALKCPFRATVMTRSFACEHAEEITRREGPDIACDNDDANKQCVEIFTEFKSRALEAMGQEDDLTTLPASVLQKIQYGGLLGLQSTIDNTAQVERIDNITALVETAIEKFSGINSLPYDKCIGSIIDYKLKRRRNR